MAKIEQTIWPSDHTVREAKDVYEGSKKRQLRSQKQKTEAQKTSQPVKFNMMST